MSDVVKIVLIATMIWLVINTLDAVRAISWHFIKKLLDKKENKNKTPKECLSCTKACQTDCPMDKQS